MLGYAMNGIVMMAHPAVYCVVLKMYQDFVGTVLVGAVCTALPVATIANEGGSREQWG